MFEITADDIACLLQKYHIPANVREIHELQRYHYERDSPDSKEVRLIVKVELDDAPPLVMRFKNEEGVTDALIESQCRFAETLRQNGIMTPLQYQADGKYTFPYHHAGYDVIVTLEEFVENEVKVVDSDIARKTGELLAKTHTIAEQHALHVDNDVLFDPFSSNDLFDYEAFLSIGPSLSGSSRQLFDRIVERYHVCMQVLAPLRAYPKYAVQGDISDCNLYQDADGNIGIFDFNRCGDNVLFCDAVMQAVFEARLMDYPAEQGADSESEILHAFLAGYRSVRDFTESEEQWYPYLYAIIRAFWSQDICWGENSLLSAYRAGDQAMVHSRLCAIFEHLSHL